MDTKFFTNDPSSKLIDRFNKTLRDVVCFDVIVAYFRVSGFYLMADQLEKVKKIRILVGINIDQQTYQAFKVSSSNSTYMSHHQTKEELSTALIGDISHAEDTYEVEKGVRDFVRFLTKPCENQEQDTKNGGNGRKLEIRAYPNSGLHAKVYISRFGEEDRDYGSVITGSSNFSFSGLKSNLEFNVELKDSNDVKFAEKKFNELWAEAVNLSKEFMGTIINQTWLKDNISPYELYLKTLYEYFKEDINIDHEEENELLVNFKKLEYQQQAVINAKRILESYNGVFLSDVVGLGKTYISAILALKLKGSKLFICPPVLKDYWEDTLRDLGVTHFEVKSSGKLELLLERSIRYSYVFVDEAHRFRNEYTQSFEYLDRLCKGKKVVLISATPFNNSFDDILALIKLFQPSRKSSIPGVSNLEAFFKRVSKPLRNHDKSSTEYLDALNKGSTEIRNKILKHLMIRRTRTEIKKYFPTDLENQKIVFPKLAPPREIIYRFDNQYKVAFETTINNLLKFKYSRYKPRFYLNSSKKPEGRELSLSGFMKSLLVKRLESSLYAFTKSIERFIHSYKEFIKMFNSGKILISNRIDIYDLLENDDESKIETLIQENKIELYNKNEFKEHYLRDLYYDLKILEEMLMTWRPIVSLEQQDPKIESLIEKLKSDSTLKNQLIVFTESKETGDYLLKHLNEHGFNVFFFSSTGGKWGDIDYTNQESKKIIARNFSSDPIKNNGNIKILVTTDVLSEGVNLQGSNVVINYDLPWNPTRVLQRVGRINRLETKHTDIFVYNFFPSETLKGHLSLEETIVSKLQAFHKVLGEDAKYLTSEEKVESHELMGEKLFSRLTSDQTLKESDNIDSDLKYLKEIRDIRDKDPKLFEHIKNLPQKARSSKIGDTNSHNELITFFRKGSLKKFFISNPNSVKEMTFVEVVHKLSCSPETIRTNIDKDYYKLLKINKDAFKNTLIKEEFDQFDQQRKPYDEKLRRRLSTNEFVNPKFTDEDKDFIHKILLALRVGYLGKNLVKKAYISIEREPDSLKVCHILRTKIGNEYLKGLISQKDKNEYVEEIVLSVYFSHE